MLKEEAIWISKIFETQFTNENYPLLNIGSSTAEFREKTQPHINDLVFKPLLEKSIEVIHTDIKKAKGVDAVGDLNDVSFRNTLKKIGVKSVLCSNLLEHLEKPQEICNAMLELLNPGGLIVVTVPHYFPFHKDPIDTMLRPGILELHAFFPQTEIMSSEIVESNNCYKDSLLTNSRYLMIMTIRLLLPFYKFKK